MMEKWAFLLVASALSTAAPHRAVADDLILHGYVEGEFVWIGAPQGGILDDLFVARGDTVTSGQRLFSLDSTSERADADAAAAALDQARANLEDLSKGARDSEIDAARARLDEARADRELARLTLERQQQLRAGDVSSEAELDQAKAAFERAQALMQKAEADLTTVGLAAREDRIAAAAALVREAEGNLRRRNWALELRAADAPEAGYVDDTYYRPGEFVPAGRPVVSLLPPGNVKLRFFVPEERIASLAANMTVQFTCDGCAGNLVARIGYIASRAEYTPPVIYSKDVRDKLVFLVEAYPEGDQVSLRPGLPVDVILP